MADISKDKAVELLKKEGYNAKNDGGVVMVYYETKEEYQLLSKNLKSYLNTINYRGSFGMRAATPSTKNIETTV